MSNASSLEEHLTYLIASVNRQLEDELSDALRSNGVPVEQFRILNALHSADGRSMRDLAAAALIDPASLTKIVDRMVADALVSRGPAPNDRRKVLIFLTTKGRALQGTLTEIHRAQEENLINRLKSNKADQLGNILRQLI